jgi:hypothetical protein
MITASSRRKYTSPNEQRDLIDTWKDGLIDSKTADRIGKGGIRSTINQMLKQDGTLGPTAKHCAVRTAADWHAAR